MAVAARSAAVQVRNGVCMGIDVGVDRPGSRMPKAVSDELFQRLVIVFMAARLYAVA